MQKLKKDFTGFGISRPSRAFAYGLWDLII